eukprot:evm.model.scf_877.4 EVM.evm.TU.scf_877.4   scf_877:37147-47291(+)
MPGVANTFVVSGKSGRLWRTRPSPRGDGLLAAFSKAAGHPPPSATSPFTAVAVSPGERLVAAADARGQVFLFDMARNRYGRLDRPGSAGTWVGFSPRDRRLLFAAFSDGMVACYDAVARCRLGTLVGHRGPVTGMAFAARRDELITVSRDALVMWDTLALRRQRSMGGRAGRRGIEGAAFVPGIGGILTAWSDGTLALWDADSLRQRGIARMRVECREGWRAAGMAVAPGGCWAAVHGSAPVVFLCDVGSMAFVRALGFPGFASPGEITRMAFMPDSTTAAAMGSDGVVRFVDVEEGLIVQELGLGGRGGDRLCDVFGMDPRGNVLAATTRQGRVAVFDLATARGRPFVPIRLMRTALVDGRVPASLLQAWDAQPAVEEGRRVAARESEDASVEGLEMANGVQPRGWCEAAGDCGKIGMASGAVERALRVVRLDPSSRVVNRRRLRTLLEAFGEYPAKYRLLIWEFLLQIPANGEAFEALSSKGLHPSFSALSQRFPIPDRALLGRLALALSRLAHWCPLFGEVPFMPDLAFPFVKLFGASDHACFEILATVMLNWAEGWFRQFPAAPTPTLVRMEGLLSHHDLRLFDALSSLPGGFPRVAWGLLSTLMSEVLSKSEWLKVWDHLVSNPPAFLHYVVLSYATFFREALMAIEVEEDIEAFLHRQRPVRINEVITGAYALRHNTPEHLRPPEGRLTPLRPGLAYPEVSDYPHLTVRHQFMEKERIQEEQEALLRRRWLLAELEGQTRRMEQQNASEWGASAQAEQAAKQEAERKRHEIRSMEQQLIAEKARLDDRAKGERLRQIQLLEEAYQACRARLERDMADEVEVMREEVAHKRRLLDYELKSKLEDERIVALELQAQRRMAALEQETLGKAARARTQAEVNTRLAAVEAHQKNQLEKWVAEDNELELRLRHEANRKNQVATAAEESAAREQLEEKLFAAELDSQAKLMQISKERSLRRVATQEAGRTATLLEEQKRREEAVRRQDEAFLRARAQEDKAWYEREEAAREEALKATREARLAEQRKRDIELKEFERLARVREGEAQLLEHRRQLERSHMAQQREMERDMEAIEESRARDLQTEMEIRLRQEETTQRLKHAAELGRIQDIAEKEEYEAAAKIRKELEDRLADEDANMRCRHQEVMAQLAVEREKQILELETAWRKKVLEAERADLERRQPLRKAKAAATQDQYVELERAAARTLPGPSSISETIGTTAGPSSKLLEAAAELTHQIQTLPTSPAMSTATGEGKSHLQMQAATTLSAETTSPQTPSPPVLRAIEAQDWDFGTEAHHLGAGSRCGDKPEAGRVAAQPLGSWGPLPLKGRRSHTHIEDMEWMKELRTLARGSVRPVPEESSPDGQNEGDPGLQGDGDRSGLGAVRVGNRSSIDELQGAKDGETWIPSLHDTWQPEFMHASRHAKEDAERAESSVDTETLLGIQFGRPSSLPLDSASPSPQPPMGSDVSNGSGPCQLSHHSSRTGTSDASGTGGALGASTSMHSSLPRHHLYSPTTADAESTGVGGSTSPKSGLEWANLLSIGGTSRASLSGDGTAEPFLASRQYSAITGLSKEQSPQMGEGSSRQHDMDAETSESPAGEVEANWPASRSAQKHTNLLSAMESLRRTMSEIGRDFPKGPSHKLWQDGGQSGGS